MNAEISPENEVLVLCARLRLGEAERAALARRLEAGVDWGVLASGAGRHGITQLVYHHLRTAGLKGLAPQAAWEALEQAYAAAGVRVMLQRQGCSELLAGLAGAGVEVIPLKGMYLREVVYPNPVLRPSGDVDLLVRYEQVGAAVKVLEGLGYQPSESEHTAGWFRPEHHHHLVPYVLPARKLSIEMHWNLAAPEREIQVDVAGLWERAQPARYWGWEGLGLAPEDILLHLALHHASDSPMAAIQPLVRLRNLADIVGVVDKFGRELDWEVLVERSQVWGTGKAVDLVLRLAQDLSRIDVPDGMQRAMDVMDAKLPKVEDAARRARGRTLRLTHLEMDSRMPETLLHLRLTESVWEKVQIAWRTMFPDRRGLRRRYRLEAGWGKRLGQAVLHPLRLVGRYMRQRAGKG